MTEQDENKYFVRRVEFDNDDDEAEDKVVTIYQQYDSDESGVVWDASLLLAKYFEHQVELNNVKLLDANCLELGTGTGFLGIWMAAMGANVMVTDLASNLELARKNIAANANVIADGHRVQVAAFDWSDRECYQWNFLGWRDLDSIDYILIADCLYYEQGVEAIYDFIDWIFNTPAHAGRVNTKVFVSYEDRDDKMDLILMFYSMIKRNDSLKCEIIAPEDLHCDYQSLDLHLLLISKRDGHGGDAKKRGEEGRKEDDWNYQQSQNPEPRHHMISIT